MKTTLDEYDKVARFFLYISGTNMDIIKLGEVTGFPFDKTDKQKHYKYRVILHRDGKMYDFPFYDSAFNYAHNKMPTYYDVLSCLEKYEPEPDVWNFAKEFGYQITSKEEYNRVRKIQQECKEQYDSLLDLFGEVWMNELREIN